MKRWLVALSLALTSAAILLPSLAEAKRLGGGGSSGMQRSMPARPAHDGAVGKPATPAQPAAVPQQAPGMPPAATPPKRSWMGPLAGIAAGLGLAALMSHFGMGAEFGNLLTMLLVGVVAFAAIRFLMRRFSPVAASGGAMQYAGAGGPQATPMPFSKVGPAVPAPAPWAGVPAASSMAPVAAAVQAPPVLPPGFDEAAFERAAKLIFLRMQAANDAADLNDLRAFTTPEMFAAVKLDLQDRGAAAQQTDVVGVDVQVLDFAHEGDNQVVSVRFHGLVREELNGPTAAFDEIWHLVKPISGTREWAIAGIQQQST